MSKLNNGYVLNEVQAHLGDALFASSEPYGMLTLEVQASAVPGLVSFLRDHAEIQMNFLTDLCGVHYPDQAGRELGVVYHLHSFVNNFRLRIKCFVPAENPVVPTLSELFGSANWQEREPYDFYGIRFEGHPNLTRILNVDEMDYFPMRKEYPLEDQTRTDKDDTYFGR